MKLAFGMLAAVLLLAGSLPASAEPTKIELGRAYTEEFGAKAAFSESFYYEGLEAASGMRATISVVGLESHPLWLPKFGIRFASTPADVQEQGNRFTIWVFSISGQSPMTAVAHKWVTGKSSFHRTFKRKLRADQSIDVDISWATPGKIVFLVDGTERHEIRLTSPVKYMGISPSTGRFRVENMVFKKK